MEKMIEVPNFVECQSTQEANEVDLETYTFLERVSAARKSFCFKIRQRK